MDNDKYLLDELTLKQSRKQERVPLTTSVFPATLRVCLTPVSGDGHRMPETILQRPPGML